MAWKETPHLWTSISCQTVVIDCLRGHHVHLYPPFRARAHRLCPLFALCLHVPKSPLMSVFNKLLSSEFLTQHCTNWNILFFYFLCLLCQEGQQDYAFHIDFFIIIIIIIIILLRGSVLLKPLICQAFYIVLYSPIVLCTFFKVVTKHQGKKPRVGHLRVSRAWVFHCRKKERNKTWYYTNRHLQHLSQGVNICAIRQLICNGWIKRQTEISRGWASSERGY